MINMEHCRFENTDEALKECFRAMYRMVDKGFDNLSETERYFASALKEDAEAYIKLFDMFKDLPKKKEDED